MDGRLPISFSKATTLRPAVAENDELPATAIPKQAAASHRRKRNVLYPSTLKEPPQILFGEPNCGAYADRVFDLIPQPGYAEKQIKSNHHRNKHSDHHR